jgi:hypothetical protein
VHKKGKNATPNQDIEGSKERKVPALVMWYLPMIDRLKCMFTNPKDAELLLWLVNHKMDGKFDTLWLVDNGNILILLIKRTSLIIQEISGLDLAQME